MDDNIKLLEERVNKVVGRLRALSTERKHLEDELNSLREQLEGGGSGGAADNEERNGWRSQKTEAIEILHQTLAELRGA